MKLTFGGVKDAAYKKFNVDGLAFFFDWHLHECDLLLELAEKADELAELLGCLLLLGRLGQSGDLRLQRLHHLVHRRLGKLLRRVILRLKLLRRALLWRLILRRLLLFLLIQQLSNTLQQPNRLCIISITGIVVTLSQTIEIRRLILISDLVLDRLHVLRLLLLELLELSL